MVYDSYAAAAAKDEFDGRAASSERVDSDFGGGLENTSISQLSKSGVDTTADKESHVDTRTESGSNTRVSMFANFKHFDIVSDPSDHHYVGETAQVKDYLYCLFLLILYRY